MDGKEQAAVDKLLWIAARGGMGEDEIMQPPTMLSIMLQVCVTLWFTVTAFGQGPAGRPSQGMPRRYYNYLPPRGPVQGPIVPGTGSVSGTIVDGVTGKPIRKAMVQLRTNPPGFGVAATYTPGFGVAATDEAGRFQFLEMPEGDFNLVVAHARYVDPFADPVVFQLTKGETKDLPVIKLMPQAVISGVVLDADGEPMPDVSVMALTDRMEQRQGQTDERGVFRLAGLRAGEYKVKAVPQNFGMAYAAKSVVRFQEKPGPQEDSVGTYYPDATDAEKALPVVVEAGQSLEGISIRLRRERKAVVRGHAMLPADFDREAYLKQQMDNMPKSAVVSPEMLEAMRQHFPGSLMLERVSKESVGELGATEHAQITPEGAFVSSPLAPGRYKIRFQLPMMAQAEPSTLEGDTEVEIDGKDVENVVVRIPASVAVSGTVRSVGRPLPAEPLTVSFVRESSGMQLSVKSDEKGLFAIPKLLAGRYSVFVFGNAPDHFTKELSVNGAKAEDGILNIPESESTVAMVVDSNGGTVQGFARGKEGSKIGGGNAVGGTVVLFPPETKQRDLVQFAELREDGTFEFRGVVPGKYRLYAARGMRLAAYNNFMLHTPRNMFEMSVAQLTKAATRAVGEADSASAEVAVKAGETVRVELVLQQP